MAIYELREKAIVLRPGDDVAVVREAVSPGAVLQHEGRKIVATREIPPGHKIALNPVRRGDPVRKYGQVIGFATEEIAAGDHVHVHNCHVGPLHQQYEVGTDVRPVPYYPKERMRYFHGYIREDGRVGTRNYIAIDATGVPVVPRETEGRPGKDATGKAKTREAKLGCVFTQTRLDEKGRPVRDEASTTYVGAIEPAEAFGPRIYAEAVRRGVARAAQVIVLGDGAVWIWGIAAEHFPGALQIVDLYHAREHLADLGKLLYGPASTDAKDWAAARCKQLDAGEVEAMVMVMRRLRPREEQVAEAVRKAIEYFQTNAERMRYARFRSHGLFVGSGVVEAGCKTIIGHRLKQSGMRWTVRGANAIIALRCAHLSGRWEEFWEARAVG